MNNTIFPSINSDYMVSEHRVLICPKKEKILEILEHNTRITDKLLRRLFPATIISGRRPHHKAAPALSTGGRIFGIRSYTHRHAHFIVSELSTKR